MISRALAAATAIAFLALAACSADSEIGSSSKPQIIAAQSIEDFHGQWSGTWRRLNSGQNGTAQVNIRRGASTFANADFILDGGALRFSQAPDFKDGKLVVDNGNAMQMTMMLMDDGRMHIVYKRFGNAGEYWLTRNDT